MRYALQSIMKPITALALGTLLFSSAFVGGCAKETSHTESDQKNWLDNGHTKQETTTYQNPDGTSSTESSKTRTAQ